MDHLVWRAHSLEKDSHTGSDCGQKEEGAAEDETWAGITTLGAMNLNRLWETVTDRKARHTGDHRVTESRMQLSHWTMRRRLRTQRPERLTRGGQMIFDTVTKTSQRKRIVFPQKMLENWISIYQKSHLWLKSHSYANANPKWASVLNVTCKLHTFWKKALQKVLWPGSKSKIHKWKKKKNN